MKLYYSQKLKISKIRKRIKKRNIFLSAIFLVIILILSYFVFLSDNFKIEYFDLGNFLEENREKELKLEFKKFRDNNYLSNNLIFSSKRIFKNFFNQYLFVKDFSLNKDWKKKEIHFEIEKRNIFGILCQKEFENCFNFDEFGFLFSESNNEENIELKILDSSGRLYELNRNILDADNFSKLLEIDNLINENIKLDLIKESKIDLVEIDEKGLNFVFKDNNLLENNNYELEDNNSELRDNTELGDNNSEKEWRIILDIDNLKISFIALNNLFLGEFNFNNLQYLDLRYLPNIYYKEKEGINGREE